MALAAAQTPVFANVVGSDFQNFNPTSNGLDFVTVQSSETLDPGILNLGLFFNYAVNALPEYDLDDELIRSRSAKHRNALVGTDLSIGLGLMRNWDVGVSVPLVVSQDVEAKNTRFQYKARGANEVRLNSKIRLLGDAAQGVAVVASASQNLIKNNAITGDKPGPTATLELAADTTFARRIAAGLNLGYRWRKPGTAIAGVPITPFHDQAIASAALSYLIRPVRTKVIFEVYGSKPSNADPEPMRALQDTAEAIFGVKHQATQHLDLNAGAGTFINKTAASPDYRLYAGINYTIGPLWDDGKDRVVKRQKHKLKVKKPDQPVEAVVTETVETFTIPNIHFQYDSDRIVLAGATQALEQVAQALRTNPHYRLISVQGHTDAIASDEYNQDLSQRRADTIRKYMIQKLRIPADKIEAVGFGESVPVASNDNYQGRQLNRRVEVKIFRGD
jgi:outer membrane protein OmpA-like peptidoglycan-associated protein